MKITLFPKIPEVFGVSPDGITAIADFKRELNIALCVSVFR